MHKQYLTGFYILIRNHIKSKNKRLIYNNICELCGYHQYNNNVFVCAYNYHRTYTCRCSYEDFAAEYSFLCGHIDFMTMEPLPHRITKHIFLGSRVIPLTKQALSNRLGITHMIVSRYQPLDWEEFQDISILSCNVRDNNSQAMMECWTACVKFIKEVESSDSGRVLIMLFGRSRSTSVVLAHLIMTRGMSLNEAWKVVHSKCWHLIDRTLAYEDQLKEWEGGYSAIQ